MGESARGVSVPAPFLTKTYDLVDDGRTEDVISWNDDGTRFVVWKTAEFAKDLLPNYFKHNNFCSFVRQLNTYGFRKTVPDKWEFANENFKRGQKELLGHIRRRKITSAQNPTRGKPILTNNLTSPANSSGEDLGSSSTSSPDSKNPVSLETQTSAQLADLSDENEKLRKDNQMLSSELSQTKKRCDELIAYLTQCMKVAPEQIHRVLDLGAGGGVCGGEFNPDSDNDENGNCMKLFGVVVKRKRGHDDNIDFSGPHRKEMKTNVELNVVPWMKISPTHHGESSKVCN